MAGFQCVGVLGGGNPRIGKFTVKDAEVIKAGEMLVLTSNEAAKGTTNDTTFIGIALYAVDNSDDGKTVECFIDPYAVYAYRDGTAHAAGATLDLGSDGMSIASTSNADFTCIANSTASEDALVIITPGEHYLHAGG